MIKKLLTVGDSFTYGEELSDTSKSWPCLVAKSLNCALTNLGKPGTGNTRIVRETVAAVVGNDPPDLIILGWSSPGRIEYADANGVYDTWPGYTGKWTDNQQRNNVTSYVNRYHNDEYLYQQYLTNVLLLQSFLKLNGVKYLMLPTKVNDYYRSTFKYKFMKIKNQIDQQHYVDADSGMMEWACDLPVGSGGHFLEDGHAIVATKVLEKIKQMEWA